MRILIVLALLVMLFSSADPIQACNNPCASTIAESGKPWWRYLIPFATAALAVYFWRLWFVPPAGIGFDPDDQEKLAAEREARETLHVFWQAFEQPALDEHDFAIKFNLTPHKVAEFIWAYDLRRTDGVLYGKLANEPFEPGYEPNQFYPIDERLIVDWSYVKNGVAKGHFLTKVMMNRMPKRFVKKAKKELGWI
jgi:uncharacterized protein YegJ (DUF2314 family)